MENKTQWKLPIRKDYAQASDDTYVKQTMCLADMRSIATAALDLLEEMKTQHEQLLMVLGERYPDVIMQYVPDCVLCDKANDYLKQYKP